MTNVSPNGAPEERAPNPDIADDAAKIVPLRPESAEPAAAATVQETAPAKGADAAPERLEGGAEARIREADAAFHRAHLRGLALLWSNLWIAFGAAAIAATGFLAAMTEPLAALGAAAAVGAAVYGFIAILAGQKLSFEHERKVAEIRRIARIGAERMRIDDPDLIPSALRDVLSEWMHSALFLRRLRQTSFWYRGLVSLQAALTLSAVGLLALLSPLDLVATGALAGAALLLTAIHWRREVRQGRERAAACALGEALDPTEAISERVAALLTEVQALRRRARD